MGEKSHVITRRETASVLSHPGEPGGLLLLHVLTLETPRSAVPPRPQCLLGTGERHTSIYLMFLSFLIRNIYHRGILSKYSTKAAN